jgi:hypothetical protein
VGSQAVRLTALIAALAGSRAAPYDGVVPAPEPGYAAGWFRLRNGQRALLYVTTRRRVLYVPTNAGYALLLSPADADGMLADLRRRAGSKL